MNQFHNNECCKLNLAFSFDFIIKIDSTLMPSVPALNSSKNLHHERFFKDEFEKANAEWAEIIHLLKKGTMKCNALVPVLIWWRFWFVSEFQEWNKRRIDRLSSINLLSEFKPIEWAVYFISEFLKKRTKIHKGVLGTPPKVNEKIAAGAINLREHST